MDTYRDYGQDRELAKQFFRDYTHVTNEGEIEPKYKARLEQLANRDACHIHVDMADLEQFNNELAYQVVNNTKRYSDVFHQALDEILPAYKTKDLQFKDPMDVFIEQRLLIAERNQRASNSATGSSAASQTLQATSDPGRQINHDIEGRYPADLIRRTEVYFKPSHFIATPIREVKAEQIGKLVVVRGIVTRATDVKPKITIVTYTCDQCGCETFQPVSGNDFTPLFECSSAICKTNKVVGKITMQMRGSKFVKSQEVKLQEHSDHVPTGHIPRSVTVLAQGELTRSCAPGDHICVSGVFLASERTGYQMMRSDGSASDTYLQAQYITQMNKTEDDELNLEPMSAEEAQELSRGGNSFLDKLSSSIAPEIFGHEDLKKALLLLLVGGVDKNPAGMKIRGNINICLMGDPGVAKSQLLSFIDRLATRSQYTTGRGSSGVGLTAAVLKDPITEELVLEGGALVLADEGICCIDEFDKMMDADRTAIHEVMEQQTVSIAKAGIMTTLNARVSILAAANPAYGRYNVHRSITDNLQLPPALLSRFDLIWLIRDLPNKTKDINIAQHITHIHSNPNDQPPNEYEAIDMKVMRRYINLCKLKQPTIPESLTERYINIYLSIRSKKRADAKEDALFTSPRSLLAIVRISTALARLRLADEVEAADIDAALSLYNCSRESIQGISRGSSSVSKVFNIIERLRQQQAIDEFNIPVSKILEIAISEGLTEEEVNSGLYELDDMESIQLSGAEVIFTASNMQAA